MLEGEKLAVGHLATLSYFYSGGGAGFSEYLLLQEPHATDADLLYF